MLKITLPLILALCLIGCQSPTKPTPRHPDAAIFEAPLPPKVDPHKKNPKKKTPRPEEYQSPLENKAPKTQGPRRHQVEHQGIVPWVHNRSNTNNVGVGSVWSF